MCRQLPFPRLWQIWGRGEKRLWGIFNSFFSYSLCPAAALSHPSRKWKGALTTVVSSSSQCALQKGQATLPGNLGTRRRRVNVGGLAGKTLQWVGRLKGSLCKKLAQGPLSTAGVLQGGLQSNQELPLTLQASGGWRHIPWNDHWSQEQASC